MERNIREIAIGILVRGFIGFFIGIPIALAAPLAFPQEDWQPQTPTSVYEFATSQFSLSDQQQYKLYLYQTVLDAGLQVSDYQKLVRIAYCESKCQHYDKGGDVLVSITHDYGYFQISHVHFAEATKMGLDVTDPFDNIKFAVYLYGKEGPRPWVCARILGIK